MNRLDAIWSEASSVTAGAVAERILQARALLGGGADACVGLGLGGPSRASERRRAFALARRRRSRRALTPQKPTKIAPKTQMNSAHHTIGAIVVAAVLLAKIGGTRWVAAIRFLLSTVGITKGGGAGERENNPELSVAISTGLLIGPTSYAMRDREDYAAAFSAPDEIQGWLEDEDEAVAAAEEEKADAKAAKAAAKAAKKEAKAAAKVSPAPEGDAEAGTAALPPPVKAVQEAEPKKKGKKAKKGEEAAAAAPPRGAGSKSAAPGESLTVEDF